MEDPPVNETDCINWNQYYTECTPGEYNPFNGAISFDNIGLAWVAIFLVKSYTFKQKPMWPYNFVTTSHFAGHKLGRLD